MSEVAFLLFQLYPTVGEPVVDTKYTLHYCLYLCVVDDKYLTKGVWSILQLENNWIGETSFWMSNS